jgi:hypothetical protein
MGSGFLRAAARLIFGMALFGLSSGLPAQVAGSRLPAADDVPAAAIPDAPVAQIELAVAADPQSGQSQNPQQPVAPLTPADNGSAPSPSPQQPVAPSAPAANSSGSATQSGSAQSSSSPQDSTRQPGQPESQHQKAAEQIKVQEHQRVAGILPSFNVSYQSDAASMTAGQKMSLAFRSATDYFPFGVALIVAGYSEADDDSDFGWGPGGFFKRAGAAYLDEFDGTIIGNGILPALLHQDPRYFRLGHGSIHHRLFYAIATSYICKHDNTHKWEPNYSNVGGNIISGAISNLYYPSQNSGWGQTITNGFVVTTEGTVGGVLNEFWPDISRKLFHKDPTHGLDAQAQAADKNKKSKSGGSNPKSDGNSEPAPSGTTPTRE